MSKDFRASQIQTTQIISSGSSGTNAKIVIYPVEKQSTALPNQGVIDSTKFNTSSIGTDIFLYVSGGINNKNTNSGSITVFGGDVHISGNLTSTQQTFANSNFFRFELVDFASTVQTSSQPLAVGQVAFPANEFTGSSLTLRAILSNTAVSGVAAIKLYNLNNLSFVHIAGPSQLELSVTGTTPTLVQSVNLVSASNFNTSSLALYELQLFSSTGSNTAQAGGGEFRPSGSFTGATTTNITSSNFFISGTWVDSNSQLRTTASVAISRQAEFASNRGTDVFFFVSGTFGSGSSAFKVAVFGGDVRISGTLAVGTGSAFIKDDRIVFTSASIQNQGGQLYFFDSGNPSGQTLAQLVTGSGIGNFFFSNTSNIVETTGSLRISQSMAVGTGHTANLINNSVILGGISGTMATGTGGFVSQSAIIAGRQNTITGSDNAAIVGGSGSIIENGDHSVIIGGGNNNAIKSAQQAVVLGGINNQIDAQGGSPTNNGWSGILGGSNNRILGGSTQTNYESAIIGGTTNLVNESVRSVIVGGHNNRLDRSNQSVIFGAENSMTGTIVNQDNFIIGAGNINTNLDRNISIGFGLRPTSSVGVASIHIGGNTAVSAAFGTNVIISASQGTDIKEGPLRVATDATINNTLANGLGVLASGQYSHAEGMFTTASADATHAEGWTTRAVGQYSHAEGLLTIASGNQSHAEGRETVAVGVGAHAEGFLVTASGDYSHAAGNGTKALGSFAFAAGTNTVASGVASFVVGSNTIGSGSNQTIVGQYNKHNNAESMLVVGGGTNDGSRLDVFLVNTGSVLIGSGSRGRDVFLFVSGGINQRTGSVPAITLFGGDVHISGTLSVNGTTPNTFWQSTANNIIFNTGSIRQGAAVTVNTASTNVAILSSQGSSTIAGLSNTMLSTDASHIRNTSGVTSHVKTNTIISDTFSQIDGNAALGNTQYNFIGAGVSHLINSGSSYSALLGSAGILVTSASVANGTLGAGDPSFTVLSIFDNATFSAMLAGGPNVISSSDGNPLLSIATIGGNWRLTSSYTYAIGDTINEAKILMSASRGIEITSPSVNLTGTMNVSGNLSVGGGVKYNPTFVTSSRTLVTSEYIVGVSASATMTLTLPSSPLNGQAFVVKDVVGNAQTNNIIVSSSGPQINGASIYTISASYGSVEIVYFANPSMWGVI